MARAAERASRPNSLTEHKENKAQGLSRFNSRLGVGSDSGGSLWKDPRNGNVDRALALPRPLGGQDDDGNEDGVRGAVLRAAP